MKALLLLSILLLAGIPARAQLCGPEVAHSTKKVNDKAAIETNAPTDKAVVYVLAPTWEGGTIQNKVSADRVWVGVTQWKSYFVVALEPGAHDFCTKTGGNANHLTLTIEAGRTYYLEQDTVTGMGAGIKATRLSQITAEDAAHQIKKCKRMIFWEKGSAAPK